MKQDYAKNFKPLFDWVLIRLIKEGVSPGGIEYPANYENDLPKAEVLAIGEGMQLVDGKFRLPLVNVGDIVLISGMMITIDSKDLIAFARESQFIAIIAK